MIPALDALLIKLLSFLFSRDERRYYLYRDFYCALRGLRRRSKQKRLSVRNVNILRKAENIIRDLKKKEPPRLYIHISEVVL